MRTSTRLIGLSATLTSLMACGTENGGFGEAQTGSGAANSTGTSSSGGSTTTTSTSSSTSAGGGTAHVPDGVLFFDDFEYDVTRDQSGKFEPGSAFLTAGWSWGKDAVLNGTGASGWLYTATTIPGFAGSMPGVESARALVVESGAGTFAPTLSPDTQWRQTDFYLQYGDVMSGSLDTIPSDVWFQHWIYIADDPAQPSLFPPTARLGKWIYPTRYLYPSQDLEWLFSGVGVTLDSEHAMFGSSNQIDIGVKSLSFALNLTDSDGNIFTDPAFADATSTLGNSGADPNYLTPISANQWWLLRLHIDHSSTPGVVEAWIRPHGGEWIKIMDTTTSATVVWTPASAEGHRGFRFPTTMNNWYQEGNTATTHGDWWIYIDDFAIAAGVNAGGQGDADLPFYP